MLFLSCRGLRVWSGVAALLPFLGQLLWSSLLVFLCVIGIHYFDCPLRDVLWLGGEAVFCMAITWRSGQGVKADSFPEPFL